LLLTHGRPWHPKARIAVAIDFTQHHPDPVSVVAARSAASLCNACGAELDLLAVANVDNALTAKTVKPPERQQLLQLAGQLQLKPQDQRVLCGNVSDTLSRVAIEREYDVISLGVKEQAGYSAFVQQLAARLSLTLQCDFLFVNSSVHVARAAS
jgi:hypothetical protein